jgi:hypothetical protein
MKHPIRGWLLGAFLLALAGVAAGEPVKAAPQQKSIHKHVQRHSSHVSHAQKQAAADEPAPSPPPFSLPQISDQYKYPSPFEMEYGSRLAHTTAATPGMAPGADDAREGAANGSRAPSAPVDKEGVPNQALHPQSPPLVTMGDWDFSADAHLPLTRTHDAGAAISAKHGF